MEAELALTGDAQIVSQRWNTCAVARGEERLGRGGRRKGDVDVDNRRVVMAVNLDRAVLVVPRLARKGDVVEAATEVVVLDVFVKSTRGRVVERKVSRSGHGKCHQYRE